MIVNRSIAHVVLAGVALTGCYRQAWPDPPAVEKAKYQEEYKAWRDERQETLLFAVRLLGTWSLDEGETPFGSDASLPIVLPARVSPPRAGTLRRSGPKVEVVPARGVPMRHGDAPLTGPTAVEEFSLGSVNMQLFPAGDGDVQLLVMASDDKHPALENLAPVETYPLDARWRVAARFEAFDAPKSLRISDVRGGASEMPAPGELVFRLNGREQRLLAIASPDSPDFFVMFKDPTNQSTTYGGYRMLHPPVVRSGEWTVLDFNLAGNPPCAYSPYTTCPLPPPQNRLDVAIEAGEKRHPTARGFQGAR